MSQYRRAKKPGGTYFFTLVLEDRRSDLLIRHVDQVRIAWSEMIRRHPVHVDAVVVLPDHLHAVLTLPPGDCDFPARWTLFKSLFSRALPPSKHCCMSKRSKREKGIWQRRYWEHLIRDDDDYMRHVEFCWINPVRHGLAAVPAAWPHSSIHRDIRNGLVRDDWAGPATDGNYGERREAGSRAFCPPRSLTVG